MKKLFFLLWGMTLLAFIPRATALAAEPELPLKDGMKIAAEVNGVPITWDDLQAELVPPQGGPDNRDSRGAQEIQREREVLKKLINVRLILQESERMNLDQLSEVQKMIEVNDRITLREQLLEEHVKDIKADDADVEKLYKQTVKEWKLKSVLFEKEDGAKKFASEVKKKGNFEELTKKASATGTAKGHDETDFVKTKELSPEIAQHIQTMQSGDISPVIKTQSGYCVVKIAEIRFSDDPKVKEWAQQAALKEKQLTAIKKYIDGLVKRDTKVNKTVLSRINYEAKKPGFEKLLMSTEVVAEVKGDNPVTVGELTAFIKQNLYHGVEKAIESKKINKKKALALEEILRKRVMQNEALRLGIDATEKYRKAVRAYGDSVIFGAFVTKVIVPEIKLNDDDLKTYYSDHKKDYLYPEMMRIEDIVFYKDSDAESAKKSIEKGTEFAWLKKNAEGQVDKNTKGLLHFEDKIFTTGDLPVEVKNVLTGTKEGDIKLYKSQEGYTYLLMVKKVITPQEQPFDEVKDDIKNKVVSEQVKKKIEEYADKLRSASEIKVYLPEQT